MDQGIVRQFTSRELGNDVCCSAAPSNGKQKHDGFPGSFQSRKVGTKILDCHHLERALGPFLEGQLKSVFMDIIDMNFNRGTTLIGVPFGRKDPAESGDALFPCVCQPESNPNSLPKAMQCKGTKGPFLKIPTKSRQG